jgi:hypothetical protein
MTQFVPNSYPDFDTDSSGMHVAFRDRGGSHHGLVTYQTSPGGVVEFAPAPVAQAIAALGQPNEYVVSDAELAALPPRLWPVDSLPYRLFRSHRGYAFGVATGSRQIVRVDGKTHAASNVYEFAEGWAVFDIFEGDGCILACAYDADQKYSLWRSDDLGVTFTRTHNLGEDPDGTHHAAVWLLNNGLRVGRINGQPATVLASYATGAAIDADPPVPGSQCYIAYSLDQGKTWQRLNTWNYDFAADTGVGQRAFRHFHTCAYDEYRDCWWFGTGDTNEHSALIRWDGRSPAPGNASLPSIAAGTYPGWSCAYGSQRWRTVDILVTEDWIETFTDTVSVNDGGIWRVRPDFTGSHRVNHDTMGIQHDGWSNLKTSTGLQIWCSNLRADAVTANQRWVGLWGSRNGNRYSLFGRVAVRAAATPLGTRGLFELEGKIWWCVQGEAGKGDRLSTNVYEPRGTFREERPDFIGPVYFVDFANGNDSNDGHSAATAWKTYRKCMIGNVVTHGARIMLSAGTSIEEGVTSIEYAANSEPATDTTVGLQISGEGRDATAVLMATSGTNGWKGSSSQYWDIENEGIRFRPESTTARLLHYDNSTQTAGTPKWTFRDCTSGDETLACTYTAYARTSIATHIRSEILNGPSLQAIRAESTGQVLCRASIIKGRVLQYTGGKVQMLNCEHAAYVSVGFSLQADATVLPELKNVLYFGGSGSLFSNASSLDVSGVIAGCVYDRVPTGMPTSPLPVAGVLDRDGTTRVPFEWSALSGAGVAAGVKWGYDGRPMRKIPSIGAIEAD